MRQVYAGFGTPQASASWPRRRGACQELTAWQAGAQHRFRGCLVAGGAVNNSYRVPWPKECLVNFILSDEEQSGNLTPPQGSFSEMQTSSASDVGSACGS